VKNLGSSVRNLNNQFMDWLMDPGVWAQGHPSIWSEGTQTPKRDPSTHMRHPAAWMKNPI